MGKTIEFSAEFKSQVKQHYDALELKQAALNVSVDRREHPTIMIAKACEYSKGLTTARSVFLTKSASG